MALSIAFQLTRETAIMPSKAYSDDIGWDIYAAEAMDVTDQDVAKISTGLAIVLPQSYGAYVMGRSGKTARGLIVTPGLIDSGYRGEIHVMAYMLRGIYPVQIGEKIAQIIIFRSPTVVWEEKDKLPSHVRGTAGFGSSGDF